MLPILLPITIIAVKREEAERKPPILQEMSYGYAVYRQAVSDALSSL
jgi:hypothetical protein